MAERSELKKQIDAQRKGAEQEKKIAERRKVGEQAKSNLGRDVNVGAAFKDEKKALDEFTRQSQIQSNVRTGRQDDAPEGDFTVDKRNLVGEEMDKKVNTILEKKSSEQQESDKEFDRNLKLSEDLKKQSEEFKVGREALSTQISEFKTFQEEWSRNLEENTKLFNQNFSEYQNKLDIDLQKSLEAQGQTIDRAMVLGNKGDEKTFDQAIKELDEQSLQEGIQPNEQSYRKDYLRLAKLYSAPIDRKATGQTDQPPVQTPTEGVSKEELNIIEKHNYDQSISAKEIANNVTVNADGSKVIPIDSDTKYYTNPNGSINWDKVDPNNTALSDIYKLQYILGKKYLNNESGYDEAEIKRMRDFELQEKRIQELKIENDYSNLSEKTRQERLFNQDRANLAEQKLEFDKANNLEDLTKKQSKSLAYTKARLSSMGATDSINGLNAIKDTEVDFASTMSRTRQQYDFKLADLAQNQTEADFAFVQEINNITTNKNNKLLDVESNYLDDINDINKSKHLTDKEKRDKMFELDNNLLSNIQKSNDAAQASKAQAETDRREFTEKLIIQQLKDSPYVYSVRDGKVEYDTDTNGHFVYTTKALKDMSSIQSDQSENDKRLSDSMGYMYKDGELILNDNNELIPTLKSTEYTNSQWIKKQQFDLDKQYRLGMLDQTTYKNKTDRLKASYVSSTFEGETSFKKRPGFGSTDGGGAEAQGFIDEAVLNQDDPDYVGGQCGFFCNEVAIKKGIGRPFGDTLNSKKDPIEGMDYISVEDFKKNPSEGFAIYDVGNDTGHVSNVLIDDNGKPYYVDSNSNLDERVDSRYAGNLEKKIIGYHVFYQGGLKGFQTAATLAEEGDEEALMRSLGL